MVWRERPKIKDHRRKRPAPVRIWHPCGSCSAAHCADRVAVTQRSMAARLAGVPIEDCDYRIIPFWERD